MVQRSVELGRVEQLVDFRASRLMASVVEERAHVVGGGDAAGQVEIDAAHELAVGRELAPRCLRRMSFRRSPDRRNCAAGSTRAAPPRAGVSSLAERRPFNSPARSWTRAGRALTREKAVRIDIESAIRSSDLFLTDLFERKKGR